MEYYSAVKKDSFESVLMRWMKLEPIIQSEVSQKEKHQYSILMNIYMEFRKMVTITTPRLRPGAAAGKINPPPRSSGCAGAGGPRGAIPR